MAKKIISALPFERSLDYGGDELYGAIWTNKGLIYVAKMNDKGELELLWKWLKLFQRVV